MADTSNEPFVKLTLLTLVESEPLPRFIDVRVCVHEELHTAPIPSDSDVNLSLVCDPFPSLLGPVPRWQRFAPQPLTSLFFFDAGEEKRRPLGEPTSSFGESGPRIHEPGSPFDDAPHSFDDAEGGFDNSNSAAGFDASARSFDKAEGGFDDSARSFDHSAEVFDESGGGFDDSMGIFDDSVRPLEHPIPSLGLSSPVFVQTRPVSDFKTASQNAGPTFGQSPSFGIFPFQPSLQAKQSSTSDFWFAPREAEEIAAKSIIATESVAIAIPLDVSLLLDEIPILGGKLPPELCMGIDGLALVWTPAGIALRPDFRILNQPFRVPLIALPQSDPFAGENTAGTNATTPSGIQPVFWINVKKTLGPLDLYRLGFGFQDEKLWLLMDASLQVGQVKVTALGLGLGLNLRELFSGEFKLPGFHIDGLGIEVRTPSMSVGGALLRKPSTTVVNNKTIEYDAFAGAMIIQTSSMTLTALGLFEAPPGRDPSLFAYGTLDKPLGGPPFFFVTRVSLGFGVNMRFELPSVDRANEFPLVRNVSGPQVPRVPNLIDLVRAASDLQPYQRSSPGTVVLGMGVIGSSFGVINTSLLVLATINSSVQIDLIGQSVLQLPAEGGGQRIADIRINWRGSYSPDGDRVSILGQVRKGSWAFHRAFQLTGEMAFVAWTRGPNAGDFVFTVGGYAPSFTKPAHYPRAARLAMGWTEKVGKFKIEVKGEGYCAITPSALMVGGGLSYSISWGGFKAWYELEAHFYLQWFPFRYSADLSLSIGASYTIKVNLLLATVSVTIEVSIGAKVSVWGPDLGGKVSFTICGVDIGFSFGASNSESPALSWPEFESNFLTKSPLALRAAAGLRGQVERNGKAVWLVIPDELLIDLESAIPAKTIHAQSTVLSGPGFGIRPMKVDDVASSDITITLRDAFGTDIPCVFKSSTRNVPAAQWGPGSLPASKRLVSGLLTGVSLSAFGTPFQRSSLIVAVEEDALTNWDTHPHGPSDWKPDLGAAQDSTGTFEANYTSNAIASKRKALLREMLGLGKDESDPVCEQRSFWIAELQETPTLKYKRLEA